MKNNDDIYYKAYSSRDARFDGKFFCAVKTTKIYCRPICPAKPKRENVEFFSNAFQAESAGYRPCLRCRPECAPGSGGWLGKNATVKRCLALIENRAMYDKNEEEFAALLGMSARHLRRLFEDELGQTPKQISDANRLNFARKLIVETKLPITEIALSSGFTSIRRFNEAFKNRFERSPSELRKVKVVYAGEKFFLRLSYRPPFDFDGLLNFYQNHLVSHLEHVDTNSYERIFKIDGKVGSVKVTQDSSKNELVLEINKVEPKSIFPIVQRVRNLFDVDSDPLLLKEAFSHSPVMKKLCLKYPGLRFPRSWDSFESAICTILGQLVSVKQAKSLVRELVENYGEAVAHPLNGKSVYLFPSADVLMNANLEKVRTTQARRETIKLFSQAVAQGEIDLSQNQDTELFKEKILKIKGIGVWTAEYIALRALGDTNAYPATDLVLKRVGADMKNLKLDLLHPWRGYVAFYLWREFAGSTLKTRSKK